jgi:hypothetical protein
MRIMRGIDPLLSGDCKQRPFLGNSSVNTFLLLDNRFLIMQQEPRCYNREVWRLQLSQFCKGVWEERTWAREAEESPLVEAVAFLMAGEDTADSKRRVLW